MEGIWQHERMSSQLRRVSLSTDFIVRSISNSIKQNIQNSKKNILMSKAKNAIFNHYQRAARSKPIVFILGVDKKHFRREKHNTYSIPKIRIRRDSTAS